MQGPYDQNNAHVIVYPGAGGDDAKDWAEMLARMYVKYGGRMGWNITETDERSFYIKGSGAYGMLKKEYGVHRLVRISPFSSKKMRHTSFALVEILPELPKTDEQAINIPPDDLKIELSRGGGPGGQNVNKVETAVRIVHIPSGLVAASRSERSQAQNKEKALSLLKAKIFQELENRKTKELGALRTKVAVEWGSQIRSYVLHPYKLVKDHRTKTESHDPDRVLEGELDKFIESELTLG
jgi:peptide chain release factor 2